MRFVLPFKLFEFVIYDSCFILLVKYSFDIHFTYVLKFRFVSSWLKRHLVLYFLATKARINRLNASQILSNIFINKKH